MIILVNAERLEVLDSGTFWFSDTPDVVGSIDWGASLPRICACTDSSAIASRATTPIA